MQDMVVSHVVELIELRNLVEDLLTFWAALQHGPGNPIVVDDQEDWERDDDYIPLDMEQDGVLWEILEGEDEPPQYH